MLNVCILICSSLELNGLLIDCTQAPHYKTKICYLTVPLSVPLQLEHVPLWTLQPMAPYFVPIPMGRSVLGLGAHQPVRRVFSWIGTSSSECTSLGTWSTDIPCCQGEENVEFCILICSSVGILMVYWFIALSVPLQLEHVPIWTLQPMAPYPVPIPMGRSGLGLGAHQPVRRVFSWMGRLTQSAPLWAHGTQTPHFAQVEKHKFLCYLIRNQQRWLNGSVEWLCIFTVCPPAKRCPALNRPSHGSLSCSHPNGAFSFASQCTSDCEEGFLLNGTSSSECTSLGTWSTDLPQCLGKKV